MPSDFSISSIREPQSILTLTDSNEYRGNIVPLNSPPTLIQKIIEPYNNPSLFKKHNKLHLVNEEHDISDKENGVYDKPAPQSTGRAQLNKSKKHKHNKSTTIFMRDNQWYGLKTSRVLSPQVSARDNVFHII